MISFKHTGDFKNTERFFNGATKLDFMSILKKYGEMGVAGLTYATPIRTGATASSWGYNIEGNRDSYKITWTNSNIHNGVPIAVILQYGHGTGTGGYVEGRDYINPALRPLFDQIAEDAWREVTNL